MQNLDCLFCIMSHLSHNSHFLLDALICFPSTELLELQQMNVADNSPDNSPINLLF